MSAGAGAAAKRLHTTFVVVSALGGALLGALQAGLGALFVQWHVSPSLRHALALALLVVLFVRQRQIGELRRWGLNIIVPASMVKGGGARTGIVWGLALGTGIATQVPNATIPAYIGTGALLVPEPAVLIATGVLFGVARAVPGVVAPLREAMMASTERTLAVVGGGGGAIGSHVTRLVSQSVLFACIVALALRAAAG